MTTYYVDGAVGNDGNAGTSEGAGNAWATIDNAMNTVVAGDTVYIKDTGTYSETANIDTAGTVYSVIRYIGYTTTPGDRGKVTITGTTNCITSGLIGASYNIFENLIITGASSHGVSASGIDRTKWVNCEFTNNGGMGAYCRSTLSVINCIFANNSSYGVYATNGLTVAGCIAYSNGQDQIRVPNAVFYKNLIYSSAVNKVCIHSQNEGPFIGNTLDGDNVFSTTGIFTNSSTDLIAFDNIIFDCETAINTNASHDNTSSFVGNNLLNANSTDYTSTDIISYDDVTGAPAFTDEAGDDYTLSDASPAINAGLQPGGIT